MPKPQRIQKPLPKWGHKGDTFREILDEWERLGLVQLEASSDRFVWWGRRNVLLYDHPRVESDIPEFDRGLFGNMQHDDGTPWIFWGRNPKLLEKFFNERDRVPIKYRMWNSIFMGKIENKIQMDNRFQSKIDWSKHIQNLVIVKGVNTPYAYSPPDYLYNMSLSKFAFLLPGFGPKCNRDIEAMACGSIPIVTPGVCVEYYDSWVEGENYFRMESETDIQKIYDTSLDQLQEMQERNYDWYNRNCTMQGSFNTTKKIIEERWGE
jgi:hypothetical protein